jgi:hypothetical protein
MSWELRNSVKFKISNKPAGLENLYDSEDIKSVWEILNRALVNSVMKFRVP